MIDWNYSCPEKKKFEKIPTGAYRLRIRSVEEKPDTSDADHYYVTFIYDVSGQNATARSRVTFLEEDPDITNTILTIMAQSFGICSNAIDVNNFSNWIGHYGAGIVEKNPDYNENVVTRFILPKDQYSLPMWVEGKVLEDFSWDEEL